MRIISSTRRLSRAMYDSRLNRVGFEEPFRVYHPCADTLQSEVIFIFRALEYKKSPSFLLCSRAGLPYTSTSTRTNEPLPGTSPILLTFQDSPPDLYSSLAMLLPRTITFLILAAAGATVVLAAPVPVVEASNIDHAEIPQDFQESAQKSTSRLTGRKGRSTNIGGPGKQPKGDNYAAILPSPLAAVVLNKWTRIASSPIYSINKEHIDHLFKNFRRHRARKADMDMLNEYLYLAAYWPAVRGAVQEELRHISPRNSQWPVLNRLSTGKIEGGDLRIAFGFTAEELEKESEKILEKIQKAALSESPTSSTSTHH
ncbi:hypothetical protein F5880DRAFT_702283 [Lentinula raphanica]|nr:hypothetical protein F5880DRAFT_702283 [Lentinula raphanica]